MSTKATTKTDQLIESAGGAPLEIPDAVRDRLSDEVIDGLLAGARSEEEIVGPGGVLAQLTKRLVERARSRSRRRATATRRSSRGSSGRVSGASRASTTRSSRSTRAASRPVTSRLI